MCAYETWTMTKKGENKLHDWFRNILRRILARINAQNEFRIRTNKEIEPLHEKPSVVHVVRMQRSESRNKSANKVKMTLECEEVSERSRCDWKKEGLGRRRKRSGKWMLTHVYIFSITFVIKCYEFIDFRKQYNRP